MAEDKLNIFRKNKTFYLALIARDPEEHNEFNDYSFAIFCKFIEFTFDVEPKFDFREDPDPNRYGPENRREKFIRKIIKYILRDPTPGNIAELIFFTRFLANVTQAYMNLQYPTLTENIKVWKINLYNEWQVLTLPAAGDPQTLSANPDKQLETTKSSRCLRCSKPFSPS